MNRTQNLFIMDWIESFDILSQPIISFCYSASIKQRGNFLKVFPEIFPGH